MNVEKILILGVGNLVMGDEGIGIHVVRELEKQNLPYNVIVIDGGTGGFHLLEYFQTYKTIILIDATMDNKLTGTISVIQPRFSSDFPPSTQCSRYWTKRPFRICTNFGQFTKNLPYYNYD